jgi:uncharacterized membrane protein YedE/YeeE
MTQTAAAPLLASGAIDAATALALAVPIGIGFGAVLERAGLADPRKLAAQFTLTDLTVLKVMLTAIVAAAAGLLWLTRVGWLDAAAVYVPPTYLVPQMIGGLLFGAGFVLGGYCPGTSCVAAAAGRLDALALIGGMLAGTTAFAELLPRFAGFYDATPMGPVTWYGLARLSQGTALALLAVGALAAFAVAERIEGRSRTGRRWIAALALAGTFAATSVILDARAPRRAAPAPPARAPAPPPARSPSAGWRSPIAC